MRRNQVKHGRSARQRYMVEYVDLPDRPQVRQLVSRSMKTVYRNLSAAPWATDSPLVERFDGNLHPLYC